MNSIQFEGCLQILYIQLVICFAIHTYYILSTFVCKKKVATYCRPQPKDAHNQIIKEKLQNVNYWQIHDKFRNLAIFFIYTAAYFRVLTIPYFLCLGNSRARYQNPHCEQTAKGGNKNLIYAMEHLHFLPCLRRQTVASTN